MMHFLMKNGTVEEVPLEMVEEFVVANHDAIQPRSLGEWRKINSIVILKDLTTSPDTKATKDLLPEAIACLDRLNNRIETTSDTTSEIVTLLKEIKINQQLLFGWVGIISVLIIVLLWQCAKSQL